MRLCPASWRGENTTVLYLWIGNGKMGFTGQAQEKTGQYVVKIA
jgi:hypothetical protein